ncbi:Cyclin-C1-1 [Cardamine amara subsp. amara]|uniref:Cyclin-C1-1 n=1 Tax=Cardamine amara subsp. amara TaxID=228776 RepID=A0ABD0ZW78_CARAN
MAANFWNSSHYKQLLDSEEVDVVHALDKERGISIDDFKLIKFHMSNHIMKLAHSIKVRQRLGFYAI